MYLFLLQKYILIIKILKIIYKKNHFYKNLSNKINDNDN